MKSFVLLTIFITVKGIAGFPSIWRSSFDNLEDLDYSKEIHVPNFRTVAPKLFDRLNFPNYANMNSKINLSPINTDTLDHANDKGFIFPLFLNTFLQEFNKALINLHEFVIVIRNLITNNQSIPVNTASNNKPQVQVTSSAPDEHVTSANNQQSTPVKNDDKENMEDNKEKLEDNKNPVTSESTISSNVPKENENPMTFESIASSNVSKQRTEYKYPPIDFSRIMSTLGSVK